MSNQIPKQVIKEVLPIDEVVEYADDINMDTQQWKERVMRCKMICLHKMNSPLTTNPKYMGRKQKAELLKMIEAKMIEPSDEIMEEFNTLVCDELLHQDANYSSYATYFQPSQHRIVPIIPPIFQTGGNMPSFASYEGLGDEEKEKEIEKIGLNL